jgi:ribose transport system substrate-binding protein
LNTKSYRKAILLVGWLVFVLFAPLGYRQTVRADLNASAPLKDAPVDAVSRPAGVVISIVPKSLDNPVFLDAKDESERICKELGIKLEWLAPMQVDAAEQERIVENLIRRKVNGIIISCIDPDRIKKLIDKAVAAGIKVATFDSDSPNSKRLFYCGTNNYLAGKACGEALIRVLTAKHKADRENQLLIMTGFLASDNLNERIRGFQDAVRGRLRLKLLQTLSCNDDINKAGELLEEYIQNNPDLDAFLSVGGWPLLVPPDSIPSFQLWCRRGGTSVVVDTFYPNLIAAKKGMADALVGQDFVKMGRLSVLYLYRAIQGQKINTNFIDTGFEIGDVNNYDRLLQHKRPWEIK